MQKFRLPLILFTTLILSNCGGVSTNPIETIANINKFNNKVAIFIIKGVSRDICESSVFRTPLEQSLTGVITQLGPKSTTCNDFNRNNNRNNGCYKEDYTETPGDFACIIGYNGVKINENNENILSTLITEIILDVFISISK